MVTLINIDKATEELKNYFNFDRIVDLKLPSKPYYNEKEIIELSKKILKDKIYVYGSDKKHFITLAILIKVNPKYYLHIDQHPDDYSLMKRINTGSFVRFIKKLTNIKNMFYVGFLKPETNYFDKYVLIKKDRSNWDEVKEFLRKLPNELYVSIDLDILKRDFVCNRYNNYNFLLDLNELLEILEEIKGKIKFIDITGFEYLRYCDFKKNINTLRELLSLLHHQLPQSSF